ncbi:Trp biosynthesis-associated membrane protein [Brachybacterium timonense]|uniref:Trp biosynthesis-associated membrane protein n=1 Tax=Brachybacterium timonense TaxID=2050896 RepID=UPI000D0B0C8D|nr:Trp biosynthesis-associated membrane protein [Brachybacterium timonense]
MRSLSRRASVLLSLVAAAALIASTRTTWLSGAAQDATGSVQELEVIGSDAAGAVLALAIAALAAALATSLSSRGLHLVTGAVLTFSGLGAAAAVISLMVDPAPAAAAQAARLTGVIGGSVDAETTGWIWAGLLTAVAVTACGILVLAAGGAWRRSEKYARDAGSTQATRALVDPRMDPAAAWDALSRGEDPSDEDPSDDDAETEADMAQ